ncbi:MAG TPA: 4a-hydroxytetrahydrobiopterin dehydratase [Casimicrobiaceae bacterium]|nr:4a-hydroxytetrahydrobiopterin dehydratase [Casimicrobiaceae bacterium]
MTSLAELAARAATQGASRLDDPAMRDALAALPGWQLAGDALEKTFRFTGYPDTIQFVNAVAWIAQRLDHHPDLDVGYNRCRVVWTTHDAQGVTINDCIAAARTEQLFA